MSRTLSSLETRGSGFFARLWRHFWFRLVVRVVAIAIVLRVVLALAMPWLVDRAASTRGLACSYDELELSLLSGDFEIRNLRLRDRGRANEVNAEPYLTLEFAQVNINVLDTLFGTPSIDRAEVDGLHVLAEFAPSGALNWSHALGLDQPSAPKPSEPKTNKPTPLDLSVPVRIAALRLHDVELHVIDRTVEPPLDERITTELRVSDVGHSNEFELRATSPELFDALLVEGAATSGPRALNGRVRVELAGFHPQRLEGALARFGLVPIGRELAFSSSFSAQIAPHANSELDCTAKLAVSSVKIASDGEEAFGLDEFNVDVATLNAERVDVALVSVNGVRGNAARSTQGALRAAGIELGSAPPETTTATAPPVEPASESSFAITCEHLAIKNGAFTFHDEAVEPANVVPFALDELTVDNISFDPARAGERLEFALRARPEGIAESIFVTGSANVALPRIEAELALEVERIDASRLAPELQQLGLATTFDDARFQAHAKLDTTLRPGGRIEADVHADGIMLTDDATLFSLQRADITGLVVDPSQPLFRIASIDIGGTYLTVRRDGDGMLHALGLRTLPATEAVAAVESKQTGNAAQTAQFPRIEVEHFTWHDNTLELHDEFAKPPLHLVLSKLAVGVDSLALGPDPAGGAPAPAKLKASLGIDGIVESLTLDGTLTADAEQHAASVKLALRGRGIDTTSLAEHCKSLGIEPTLKNGSLACDIGADVKLGDGVLDVSLDLRNAELREGEEALATLDRLRVAHALIGGDALRCASITIERPMLRVARDADGSLNALGAHIPKSIEQVDEPPRTVWQQLETACAPITLPALELGELKVDAARLRWIDSAIEPAAEFRLRVNASVSKLTTGANAQPAPFDVSIAIGQILGDLHAKGTLTLDPHALDARGELALRELSTERLLPYFPAGITSEIRSGWIKAHFALELADAAPGGRQASFVVDDFSCGHANEWFADFDQLALRINRIDPAARVFDIGEVSFAGARIRAARIAPTSWSALGFEIDTAQLATLPDDPPTQADAPAPAPRPIDHGAPPTISLGKLDLGIANFSFFDRTLGDDSRPIDVSVRLTTPEPCTLLDSSLDALPPFRLKLAATLEPLVQTIDADFVAAPWLAQPEFDATLAVRGINAPQILSRFPHLPLAIDGEQLVQGAFDAHAHGELRLERRVPTDFDASKPFGAELTIDRVAFRAEPEGEVLAGLEGARADITRIDPISGDIAIKSLELTKPIGRVERAVDGLHVLGLVIAPPAAQVAETPVNAEVSAPAEPTTSVAAAPGPELRIDRLTIEGLDFIARDTSVNPPVELPLIALDVDVRKLSRRGLREGQALKFNAFVGAGKVALPKRVESDSWIEGAAAATTELLSGTDSVATNEERMLFDEIAIAGSVAVAPQLTGWATVDVAALELPPFRGISEPLGVTIGDGVLDQTLRVRFHGEQGMSVDARSTFSHLSLSEHANGPIERYLSLPAPLDSVLFLLKDFEGQHEVPVSFRMTQDGLSSGAVSAAAVSATATVIATAVASSPLRVAGTLTDLLGITGGDEPPPGDDAVVLKFDPGASALSSNERGRIAKLAAKLESKSKLVVAVAHEFGGGDIARAEQLGNPALDDCRQLSLQLRQKKAEIERRRAELAAETRVTYAVGSASDAAAATKRLHALDAELGLTEDALDRLHELLKPGAERRREQRTRGAALAIASERVERVRQALLDSGVAPERIEVRQIRVRAAPNADGGRIVLAPRERKQ